MRQSQEGRALRQFTLSTGKSAGRNSSGRITVFHRGGGSKRLQRRIDLKRSTSSMGIVERIEYDPNRSSRIAPVRWKRRYFPMRRASRDTANKGLRRLFWFLIPYFFLTILLVIFDLLCLKMGSLDLFQELLEKVGFSLGSRALSFFLIKMGCSGGMALAIGFAVKAILANEAPPYLGNLMLPAGGSDASSSSGNWREYQKLESPKEGDSTLEPSNSSSWGGSWIDRHLDKYADTSASASAAEAETVDFPFPEISQGEMLGDSPNPQAPTSTSTGGGTHFPSAEEIGGELRDFLSSFSKIQARSDFIINIYDKLDILHASPEKLEKLHQLMQEISQSQQDKPATGRKAADLLIKLIRAWEKRIS